MSFANPLLPFGAPGLYGAVEAAPAFANPFSAPFGAASFFQEPSPESRDALRGHHVPLHQTGLTPVKSCLKRPRHPTRALAGVDDRRVSLEVDPYFGVVTGRCAVTGTVVFPHGRRDKSEWHRRRSTKERPDWTSDLDEPMTGVSDDQDLAAAESLAEEDELDRRLFEAAQNWGRNKAECPVSRKHDRWFHPAVLESKAQRHVWNS
ncbi:hypothetical protein B0T14DRAFT_489894 [Immersiella caudata]|uniref:Uncharacterized protein n=1 Tax=Immersiella caudata TaxID=314043 RepID=A0AA40CAN2_9PEZI|nr:hypothetical protein B0T14DRAFT_489894 [Immersiella caudata]